MLGLTGGADHCAVRISDLYIVYIAIILDGLGDLGGAILIVTDADSNIIHSQTSRQNLGDIKVVPVGQILDQTSRPCGMVGSQNLDLCVALTALVNCC